jgi:hypothetical protein
MDEVEFYLEDLKSKFKKINPNEYYLSYSGGRDSHFLYWFLKIWLKENDHNMWNEYRFIKIVSVNTRMEHPQILRRMIDNSDVVLLPKLKPFDIKKKYGSPCFSKIQDQMIYRYNNGNKSKATMMFINGTKNNGNTMFKLNQTAKKLLLSGKLHNVSDQCCKYLKKTPMKIYGKQNNTKPIIGIRASEGLNRKTKYTSCFTKNGKFTPIYDLTDDLLKNIELKYKIKIPKIYKHIKRTGCMGCPYGSYMGDTKIELDLLPKKKRDYIIKYFKESYDVLGIEYETQQLNIWDLLDKEE